MNIKFITTLVCAISFHFALSQVDPMSTRMYKTDKYGKVVIDTNYRPPQNLKRIVTKAVESTTLLLDANDVYVHPGNTQLEVHISINKQNPNRLIASANTYIGHASQGYYYSNDGGITWAGNDILENSANPNNPNLNWINGDPSTAIDVNGKTFIETIIYDGEGIGSQNSINGSTNWTQLASAVPNSGVAFQNFDKPMIAIDNEANSPYVNNYYCAWTDFTGGVNNRKVVLNRSINSGGAFTIPITLKNGFGQGTSVQTGPNGEVYVCWADYDFGEVGAKGLGFTKSIDGGSSFSSYSRSFNYIGIRDYSLTPTFNNARMNDFPVMAVDKSSTNKRGRIYVCYPTKENGLANGKSIVEVRYSDNEGSTWSNPVMASLTVANQSFFPWITVDDCDGDVYLVYFSFDTQTNYETNTYVAHSSDGGITWENQKVSDVSHIFAPLNGPAIPQGYISDYIGITAYKGKASQFGLMTEMVRINYIVHK